MRPVAIAERFIDGAPDLVTQVADRSGWNPASPLLSDAWDWLSSSLRSGTCSVVSPGWIAELVSLRPAGLARVPVELAPLVDGAVSIVGHRAAADGYEWIVSGHEKGPYAGHPVLRHGGGLIQPVTRTIYSGCRRAIDGRGVPGLLDELVSELSDARSAASAEEPEFVLTVEGPDLAIDLGEVVHADVHAVEALAGLVHSATGRPAYTSGRRSIHVVNGASAQPDVAEVVRKWLRALPKR